MRAFIELIKTTVIGGFVFLIPLAIMVFFADVVRRLRMVGQNCSRSAVKVAARPMDPSKLVPAPR